MLVCITGERNKEVLTTTSRKIAEVFEKNHKEVLRDIESLSFSNEFRERNFALSSYTSEQNKALKEYQEVRDNFSLNPYIEKRFYQENIL